MTEFETKSLAIATKTMNVFFVGNFITIAAVIVAAVGGIFAYMTLQTIIKQLESAKWNSLLSFEADLSARRDRFHDIARELEQSTPSTSIIPLYNEAKENYLNAIERLASSMLNGQFPELEMKQSYRTYMDNTIREFPDAFKAGTAYRKTLKLHEKWQD